MRRRTDFMDDANLLQAYAVCRTLCGRGNLSGERFLDLVRIADTLDVWSYRNLELWTVPFILLTLDDFEGVSRGGNDLYFRFVFQKPARTGWMRSGFGLQSASF